MVYGVCVVVSTLPHVTVAVSCSPLRVYTFWGTLESAQNKTTWYRISTMSPTRMFCLFIFVVHMLSVQSRVASLLSARFLVEGMEPSFCAQLQTAGIHADIIAFLGKRQEPGLPRSPASRTSSTSAAKSSPTSSTTWPRAKTIVARERLYASFGARRT